MSNSPAKHWAFTANKGQHWSDEDFTSQKIVLIKKMNSLHVGKDVAFAV